MTIDEMRTVLTGDENDSLIFVEAVNKLDDLLKELNWYRGQDLIRRGDAKKTLYERFGRKLITGYIDKVSNAKPPKENE